MPGVNLKLLLQHPVEYLTPEVVQAYTDHVRSQLPDEITVPFRSTTRGFALTFTVNRDPFLPLYVLTQVPLRVDDIAFDGIIVRPDTIEVHTPDWVTPRQVFGTKRALQAAWRQEPRASHRRTMCHGVAAGALWLATLTPTRRGETRERDERVRAALLRVAATAPGLTTAEHYTAAMQALRHAEWAQKLPALRNRIERPLRDALLDLAATFRGSPSNKPPSPGPCDTSGPAARPSCSTPSPEPP